MRHLIAIAVVLLAVSSNAQVARSQTLQEFSPVRRKDSAQVTLFASGNVKDVVGQSATATSATGSLGVTYRGSVFIVTGLINVLGTTDTVTKGYGATLLAPATGRAFNSGLLEIRFPHLPAVDRCVNNTYCILYRRLGVHGYIGASQTRWATNISPSNAVTATADVPVWSTGVGLYYTFFDGAVPENNRVAMALDFAWATRHVRGDLYHQDSLRASLLGTTSRDFSGFEAGLIIRYNEIQAGVTYYSMSQSVAGLSNGQIVAAIAVQAKLSGGRFKSTTCLPGAVRAPMQPSATSKSPGQIELSWARVEGATSYAVFRATTEGGEATSGEAPTVAATSYKDSDSLVSGTAYFYVIEARNDNGCSARSHEVSATAA